VKSWFETLEERRLFSTSVLTTPSEPTVRGPRAALGIVLTSPSINSSNIGQDAVNIARDRSIIFYLNLPNGGVDQNTLKTSAVRLTRDSDGAVIATNRPQTSGGGDTIVLQPKIALDKNTKYTATVTASVKDVAGAAFVPYALRFTTGTAINLGDPNIKFDKTKLTVKSRAYTGITLGPDHRLYAATLSGYIYRWDLNTDGTVKNEKTIDLIRKNNGNIAQFVTGIVFDPRSTADNPILWVSHGAATLTNAPNDSGAISKLTGKDLTKYEKMITRLPRSVKDHMNNQLVFSPDGANIYFTQPSQNAMGAPDTTWGNRAEVLLSAAILRLNVAKIEAHVATRKAPLDAKTHNPYNSQAPLRIWATGMRNAFDLLFHSNGHLYAPANGSALGGNTPATPGDLSKVPSKNRPDFGSKGAYTGPTAPALAKVQQTQNDFLHDIVEGGYYGHPNPLRGEYVLDGGNPTSGTDKYEFKSYPVGTNPDRNFRGAVYDFGQSFSPDGVIEYNANRFGGRLKGYMLVARYSGGDDIVAIKVKPDGTIDKSKIIFGIQGFNGFENPLDLIEDRPSGNIYVTELIDENGSGNIQLLRPNSSEPHVKLSASRLSYYNNPGTTSSKTLTIQNTGTKDLLIELGGIRLTGTGKKAFAILNTPTGQLKIGAGKTYNLQIQFSLGAGDTERKLANLVVDSNDIDYPTLSVQLRGNSK